MATNTGFGFVGGHNGKFDDFDRMVYDSNFWTLNNANSATNFAINTQVNGVVRGTVTNNSRNDTAIMYGPIIYKPSQKGPVICEVRMAQATSLSTSVFCGLTDAATVEIPLQWSNAAFTSPASDAIGFYRGASSVWRYGGVAADVDSAQGTAANSYNAVLATFQTFRVVLNASGKGSFYLDGNCLAENVSGCATATTLLCPQVSIRDDGAAGSLDVDYIYVKAARA
jgi:hypothetical protein